jgi:hypothetical protein
MPKHDFFASGGALLGLATARTARTEFENRTMELIHYVSYFFGGVFLANAIPHFVSGMMGRPFQSPFAEPPVNGLHHPPQMCSGARST